MWSSGPARGKERVIDVSSEALTSDLMSDGERCPEEKTNSWEILIPVPSLDKVASLPSL
jgi:hypothetical protein